MSLPRNPLARTLVTMLPLWLAGCAIGNTYDYTQAVTTLPYHGSGTLKLAVQDQRPDVLKDPTGVRDVGTQRTRMGIPFDVTTTSGRPLAEDMSLALKRTLETTGYSATAVDAAPTEPVAALKMRLLAGAPKRAVLLHLGEWNSDTLMVPTVRYDLTLTVLDARGSVLGTTQIKGEEDLKGARFTATQEAKKNIPLFFQKRLEQMLNAPEIRKALSS